MPENFESTVPLAFPSNMKEEAKWALQFDVKTVYALYKLLDLNRDCGEFDDKQKGG
ncbi:MAG: hypothetical protein IT342_23655 [Candidatus Melainabacteria bacterium]|nr:hypothetical protein [Candidatus Melainabacteria bacterium]